MNLKPTRNYVLVKPVEAQASVGNVLLPESAKEVPTTGQVVSIGVCDEKPEFKVGDLVVYRKWAGDEIKFGEETYICVKLEDILVIQK